MSQFSVMVMITGSIIFSFFIEQISLQFQPSVKKASLHESPHTCCIHQFLMYTSVYKDSTAFWPAASGTQCKAKIRVTYTWGKKRRKGKRKVMQTVIARLLSQPHKKKKKHTQRKVTCIFSYPQNKIYNSKFYNRMFYVKPALSCKK